MNKDWVVQSISMDRVRWGENEGKYKGSIKFENGGGDSFTFALRHDMCQTYLRLIAGEVVLSANELAQRLLISLGLSDTMEIKPMMLESKLCVEEVAVPTVIEEPKPRKGILRSLISGGDK